MEFSYGGTTCQLCVNALGSASAYPLTELSQGPCGRWKDAGYGTNLLRVSMVGKDAAKQQDRPESRDGLSLIVVR